MNAKTATERLDVRGALREGMARLSEARVPSHSLAAELLLMHALGCDRAWLYSHPEELLSSATAEKFVQVVAKRASGVPTQYLTGRQEFWGLEFEVTPAVLIPRPETEHVIEVALERLGGERRGERLQIGDVGTGSGCIGVALAKELPRAEIFATDVSAEALEVARRNAVRHNLADRIHFLQCNLLEGCGGNQHESLLPQRAPHAVPLREAPRFDLIVSNPPYVGKNEEQELPREVRDHEPPAALFGGPTGVEIYEQIIDQAERWLASGGILVLELGYNSLDHVRGIFESRQGWKDLCVTGDLAGIARVFSAERTA
ncbi:MAG: peptide chain release factor N(5)-glutamine methyltransferase [Candidatus Acidiferrales bacterium]